MSSFIENSELYPMKFAPVYQERIWGGNQLKERLNRKFDDNGKKIGESWELVDREDVQSVLLNGSMAGKTLSELVEYYKNSLVGTKGATFDRFPLLVKLIDAGDRLSLQVHPDEQTCARLNNGAEPKTEMWYVIGALPNAKIMAGIKSTTTKQQILSVIDKAEVENYLQVFPSIEGDAYYITSGMLHAIGAGNLILEIQQNSDTTYRISDWGRVDENGNSRELHVDVGIESINFLNKTLPRVAGAVDKAPHNRKFEVVNKCPFFKVYDLRLNEIWSDATSADSFHLISAISGGIRCGRASDMKYYVELMAGETALIPASFGPYTLTPLNDTPCTVIKSTL